MEETTCRGLKVQGPNYFDEKSTGYRIWKKSIYLQIQMWKHLIGNNIKKLEGLYMNNNKDDG